LIQNDRNIVNHVRVGYEELGGKTYFLDRSEVRRSSDVIGLFPIVVLSPGDFALTGGSPSERRIFMDMVLSQISRSYLEELVEYRRALKQRNKVLLDAKLTGALDIGILSAWTDALVTHGTRVMAERWEFVKEFQPHFTEAYLTLVEHGEAPSLVYKPSFVFDPTTGKVIEDFYFAASRLERAERMRGATLVGPHRDDLEFVLNDLPIREFASQGQHKTFLVALKIAEFHYIKSKLDESPAMLLDDVMTELDYSRATRAVRAISTLGQAFLTSTEMLNFDEKVLDMRETKFHVIREGTVAYHRQSSNASTFTAVRS
jgi:DNA replication and repair protein RecF